MKGEKMARKLNMQAHADDSRMVDAVRNSVEQIWQAGLGAFAKAQQEGEEMFSKLVQEGMAVQKRTQNLAGEQLADLSETVAGMAESLGRRASGSLEKLESVFEDRMAQAMRSLGVPTHNDIEALGQRIGELHEMINKLIAQKHGDRPAARKAVKPAKQAAKSAVKKTAPKKKTRAAARKSPASTATRA
ncbi:polygranule-associated protein [Noviherbaspirillum sp. UKPF54]|nr:polygranule-associated protein [Noviherbaspirillum sp. UKPF54]